MNYNYPYYANTYGYQPNQNVQAYQQQSNQTGFVPVPNENVARTFPVGLNQSVTFRDESKVNTYYTKTMGSSPLDSPTFECFRLVKVDMAETATEASESHEKERAIDLSVYVLKTDLQPLEAQIVALRKEVDTLKERPRRKILKEVEVEDDEQ